MKTIAEIIAMIRAEKFGPYLHLTGRFLLNPNGQWFIELCDRYIRFVPGRKQYFLFIPVSDAPTDEDAPDTTNGEYQFYDTNTCIQYSLTTKMISEDDYYFRED